MTTTDMVLAAKPARLLSLATSLLSEVAIGDSSSALTSTAGHDPFSNNRTEMLLTRVLTSLVARGVRATSTTFFNLITSKITVRLELDSRDELFTWAMEWLAQEHDYGRTCTQLVASAKSRPFADEDGEHDNKNDPTVTFAVDDNDDGRSDSSTCVTSAIPRPLYFFPSAGIHFFWYKWRLFMMARSSTDRSVTEYGQTNTVTTETMTLYTLGWSRKAVLPLLNDIRAKSQARDSACTSIFTGDRYGNWCKLSSRPSRPLDSVVIDAKVKEDLVRDVKQFMRSAKFYTQTGLPYRRGYLLYGPPGTGKSSLVVALAGSLNLPIYVLSLGSNAIDDYNLLQLLIDAPTRCIILLEDVHTLFNSVDSDSDYDSDSDSDSDSGSDSDLSSDSGAEDGEDGDKKRKRKSKSKSKSKPKRKSSPKSKSTSATVPAALPATADSNASPATGDADAASLETATDDDGTAATLEAKPDSTSTSTSTSESDSDSDSDDSDDDSDDGKYRYTAPEMNSKISMSTLLNVLDGVIASEGRLLFMTTNSTNLDPAILRPGRIDRKMYLGNATPAIATELTRRFMTWEDGENVEEVKVAERAVAREVARVGVSKSGSVGNEGKGSVSKDEKVGEDKWVDVESDGDGDEDKEVMDAAWYQRESNLSPAQVVGFLMRYREDPMAAVANIKELRTMHELVAM